MRPSLPPDMGDNAAAQATLEARLRREQIKRVSHVEDLANVVGNAADGQALIYSQATGAWQPGSGATNLAFGQAGTLIATFSPPIPCPVAGTIDGASFALGTSGTTQTTVGVYKNGTLQFSVVIPSSSTLVVTVTGQAIAVAKYDKITCAVTQVGTNAADLGGFVHII